CTNRSACDPPTPSILIKTALAVIVIAMTLLELSAPFSPVPNDTVKLIECPRDAWQGLKRQIPTEVKVEYLRARIGAGFKHIDAVSFVSPKTVPQMADREEELVQLRPPD